jgi:hypothetical protein
MDPQYLAGQIVESYISPRGSLYSHETQANLAKAIAAEIERSIAQEREACAKLAENWSGSNLPILQHKIAAAIRGRE